MNEPDWEELQVWLHQVAEQTNGWADRIDPERMWKGGSVRPLIDQVARSASHADALVTAGARA